MSWVATSALTWPKIGLSQKASCQLAVGNAVNDTPSALNFKSKKNKEKEKERGR